MIIGSCPYPACDEGFSLASPDEMPVMQKHICEGCGLVIWTHHSRVDPWSMTESDFHEVYTINDTMETILRKLRVMPPSQSWCGYDD